MVGSLDYLLIAKSSINISFTLSSYKLETKGNNYSHSYNVFRLVLNVSHGHKYIMYYVMQKSHQKRIHLFKHHINSGVYCQCWIALVLQLRKKFINSQNFGQMNAQSMSIYYGFCLFTSTFNYIETDINLNF